MGQTKRIYLTDPVAWEICESEDEVRYSEIGDELKFVSKSAFECAERVHNETSNDHSHESDEDRDSNELVFSVKMLDGGCHFIKYSRYEMKEREYSSDEALIAQRQSIRLVSERSWVRTPVRALLSFY